MAGPFQGYSIFDSLMRESISRQRAMERYKGLQGRYPDASDSVDVSSDTDVLSTGISRPTGQSYSAFMNSAAGSFASGSGQVVNIAENPELRGVEGIEPITNAKAAAQSNLGSVGLSKFGNVGKIGSAVVSAITSAPYVDAFFGGNKTVDPYGKETYVPLGIVGAVARQNIQKQYEVAEKIKKGVPGHHQFYSGNSLLSIVPQTVFGQDVGYGVLGSTDMNSKQVIGQYAAMYGYDPDTVDLTKRPGERGFGVELTGFIPGVGGLSSSGEFVDAYGSRSSQPPNTSAYFGMVSDIYGNEYAANEGSRMGLNADSIRDIATGAVSPKTYTNREGDVVGYGTGTGGMVTTEDGFAVQGGSGYVSSGTGYIEPEKYNNIKQAAQQQQDDDDEDDYSADDAEDDFSEGGAFASGGFVKRTNMQEGGEVPVANGAAVVGDTPENIPNVQTVADDINVDVPEGSFVLNAAAVEYMGSADVKKMILEAIKEAEQQGVDIKQENSKIPREELVSLAVSRGEVIIPPQLAEIIGYDRLTKINNRGKAEVERRQAEAEQQEQAPESQEPPGIIKAAEGVDTRGMLDLDDTVNYREFKNPQSSWLNMFEVLGAGATGNLEAMEKAYSYSENWGNSSKADDRFRDTMRHQLVGGLYGDVAGFYADAKEQYHKYVEASPRIGYEKVKGMLGYDVDEKKIENLRGVIRESDVDLNNNTYGRELRRIIPDEKEYVRAVERIMNIALKEGIDKVPSVSTKDGEQIYLQLSTVQPE